MDVEYAGKMIENAKEIQEMLHSSVEKNTLSKTTSAFFLSHLWCSISNGKKRMEVTNYFPFRRPAGPSGRRKSK